MKQKSNRSFKTKSQLQRKYNIKKGKPSQRNQKIFLTYDKRREIQSQFEPKVNPQIFNMTKINQQILVLLDQTKPQNVMKNIPQVKKHLKLFEFYQKNFTMRQLQMQKTIDKIKIDNQRLIATVKEQGKSLKDAEDNIRKLQHSEYEYPSQRNYKNKSLSLSKVSLKQKISQKGNETPTRDYYIPLPMQASQSGHNTDSDFTETVTPEEFQNGSSIPTSISMMQTLEAFLIDTKYKRSELLEKPLKNILKAFKDGILLHQDFTDMEFCIYFLKKIDNAFKKMKTQIQANNTKVNSPTLMQNQKIKIKSQREISHKDLQKYFEECIEVVQQLSKKHQNKKNFVCTFVILLSKFIQNKAIMLSKCKLWICFQMIRVC